MREYDIAIIRGDGIGQEVIAEGLKVIEAINHHGRVRLNPVEIPAGRDYFLEHGREWPKGALDLCRNCDAILLGAIGWPGVIHPNGDPIGKEVVLGLRNELDLFANVRPINLYPGVTHSIHGEQRHTWNHDLVDLVIIRENTEGLYAPINATLDRSGEGDLAIDVRPITKKGCERIHKFSFSQVKKRNGAPIDGISRVTCVDKSNLLAGDRMFRNIFNQVAKSHQDIKIGGAYIDAFCLDLLQRPEKYDVVVIPNEQGDIATDVGSILQGGLGMAPSANIGDEYAMFEPVHGSAPDIAGNGEANPIATILSLKMLLEWLGDKEDDGNLITLGMIVGKAIAEHLLQGDLVTPDLGGIASTEEVGDAIATRIKAVLQDW